MSPIIKDDCKEVLIKCTYIPKINSYIWSKESTTFTKVFAITTTTTD